MTHGTRRMYQRGNCRCTPCRAANAAYLSAYRLRKATGRPLLGAKVSAAPAVRMVKALAVEGFTEAEVAYNLGLPDGRLRWHTTRITVRNLLKLRRFVRLRLQ